MLSGKIIIWQNALPGLARRFQIAMPIEISYNYGVNKKANVREHVSPNVLENRRCLHFKLIKVSHHLRAATHKDVFSFWSEMTDHVAAGYEGSNHNDYDRGQSCILNANW